MSSNVENVKFGTEIMYRTTALKSETMVTLIALHALLGNFCEVEFKINFLQVFRNNYEICNNKVN